jgi:hypothetical protein
LGPGSTIRPASTSPLQVTLDARLDPEAEPVGRTHPLVAGVADEVLSRAFAAEPDHPFARAGATFTNAVDRRTALLLLRIRYQLREETGGATQVESFAEGIVLAACRREDGPPRWLEPIDHAGRALADRAEPRANMEQPEKREHVAWALDFLDSGPWFRPVIEHRVGALANAHARLRRLTKAPLLEIQAHEPPDIMGCFVLVPIGRAG